MTGARRAFILLFGIAVAGSAGLYVGYRFGEREARRESAEQIRRLSRLPEATVNQPATWETDNTTRDPAPASAATAEACTPPIAIDVARPVRISWPLDIGPDVSPDRPDARACLRARQGVNELQTPGTGKAFYAFCLASAVRCRTYFRVRYPDDGVGSVACNNSWFVGFDASATSVIEGDSRGRDDTSWHWERGPDASLSAGVHWLRVELREDGPMMDRAILIPAATGLVGRSREEIPVVAATGLAGALPPFDPQRPVREVECFALPTKSLVIGKGHTDEITVGASWHGPGVAGFHGTIDVRCPTAADITVRGQQEIACGPSAPFATNVLTLTFPRSATRRPHVVVVRVVDAATGRDVHREEIRFIKGYAWAFLGPFRTEGRRGSNPTGATVAPPPVMSCDADPRRIAMRADVKTLGLNGVRSAGARAPIAWRVVDDGSCYNWTGAVDLRRVYGRHQGAFAYAVTWIRAETTLQHRSFNFQCDDAGWLWLNGRFTAVLPVGLPREANRLWSSARLSFGLNPVVVKLTQTQHYWGFRFDVIDWHWQGRRGDIITGVTPDKWPKPR